MDDRRLGRLVDLLSHAYGSREAMLPLVRAAGLTIAHDADVSATVPELWRTLLDRAIRSDRFADLMAEVLNDPSSSVFHGRMHQLLGDRLFGVLATGMLRHGLPLESNSRDALLESMAGAVAPAPAEPVGSLQAIVSPPDGINDPMAYGQAIVDATRRVVMIEVGGRPRGTGLLVGPDLVLTAAHVFDATAWPPPGPPSAVVVFDFVRTPGRSEAETGIRIDVRDFVCGSLPSPAEVAGNPNGVEPGLDRLDFALLRLSLPAPAVEAPGGPYERGHYRLDPTEYAFAEAPRLFIVQHPLGAFQAMTFLDKRPVLTPNKTRITYRGNTLAGSSGSPVLDVSGRLVAIHHYAANGHNQGVPIAPIADQVLGGPFAALFTAAVPVSGARPGNGAASGNGAGPAAVAAIAAASDPFAVNRMMQRPYVNRDNLRSVMRTMTHPVNGNRMLVISGSRNSGVTHSYRLVAYVASQSRGHDLLRSFAPGGMEAVRINLREYADTDSAVRLERIIGDLTLALKLRRFTDPIAQDARNVVTLGHWIRAELSGSDKQWWIFFDSIDDAVEACPGQVAELMHQMLSLAQDPQVPLRVILGGPAAAKVAADSEAFDMAALDTTTGLIRADVERWIKTRVAEEGGVVDAALLDAELGTLFPDGGSPMPIDLIAAHLPEIVGRLVGVGVR